MEVPSPTSLRSVAYNLSPTTKQCQWISNYVANNVVSRQHVLEWTINLIRRMSLWLDGTASEEVHSIESHYLIKKGWCTITIDGITKSIAGKHSLRKSKILECGTFAVRQCWSRKKLPIEAKQRTKTFTQCKIERCFYTAQERSRQRRSSCDRCRVYGTFEAVHV